jgi:NADP-dependent 3-hydroxy acid dehydrogenase YdfG
MPDPVLSGVAGHTVLIAGATSAAGLAAARALVSAGARVVAVGRDAAKLADLEGATFHGDESTVRVRSEVCDLTDETDVNALAHRVHVEVGPLDGVLHLVGGWRGGGGLAGQSDEDFRFLEQSFTALRHVSRAFDADLRESDAGRLAIVSSTAVARPLAGGANYVAVKAASEAWARAVAQGFAKAARDAGEPLRAASVVFRVKALAGLEATLADAYVSLFESDPALLNDTVLDLSP